MLTLFYCLNPISDKVPVQGMVRWCWGAMKTSTLLSNCWLHPHYHISEPALKEKRCALIYSPWWANKPKAHISIGMRFMSQVGQRVARVGLEICWVILHCTYSITNLSHHTSSLSTPLYPHVSVFVLRTGQNGAIVFAECFAELWLAGVIPTYFGLVGCTRENEITLGRWQTEWHEQNAWYCLLCLQAALGEQA